MAYFLFAKQHIVWNKIGTEKSFLFVNIIDEKQKRRKSTTNFFSKKDQQQHFAFIVMTSWRF